MTKDFKPISFDVKDQYLELLNMNKSRASDYCFSNLWGWGPYYGLELRFEDKLCWIRQTKNHPDGTVYWAPVGDWEAVEKWAEKKEMQAGNHFIRVPQKLTDIWTATMPNLEIKESRGHWDYIYLAEELAELPGSKFHQKKNHLNHFLRTYNYEFLPLCENGVDDVLAMQEEWCRWKDCEDSKSLQAENDAIERVLSRFGEIKGLTGGIIRVYGKPVAYTLAEALHDDTLVIHFEKADTKLKGSYQAINYLFANKAKENFKYLNREQDLDEPGLRAAKESYNPVFFAEKNELIIK